MPPPNDSDATPQPISPPRFRVTLICPTPVAHPELDVEAEDEAAAWKQFCTANGISGSEHPHTIVPLCPGSPGETETGRRRTTT